MMRCLAPDCQKSGLGCDNMTVVLICFLNGQSYEELQMRCQAPNIAGPGCDIYIPNLNAASHVNNMNASTELVH